MRIVTFSPPPPISSGTGVLDRLRLERRLVELVELALEAGLLVREQTLDDLARLFHAAQAPAHRVEGDPVGAMLILLPASTQSEHEPAPADVVDGGRHLGQHRGMAIGVSGDQRTDLDPGNRGGEGRDGRPRLAPGRAGVRSVRHEVVGEVDSVPPRGLRVRSDLEKRLPGLLAGPEAEAHGCPPVYPTILS